MLNDICTVPFALESNIFTGFRDLDMDLFGGWEGSLQPATVSYAFQNFFCLLCACTHDSLCLENSLPECYISEWKLFAFRKACSELFNHTCIKMFLRHYLQAALRKKNRKFPPYPSSCPAPSISLALYTRANPQLYMPIVPNAFLCDSHSLCVQQPSDCKVPEGNALVGVL